MPLYAVWGSGTSGGTMHPPPGIACMQLLAAAMSKLGSLSIPYRSATDVNRSIFSWSATCAKVVSHETSNARSIVMRAPPGQTPPVKFRRTWLVWGRLRTRGFGNVVEVVMLVSRPAVAVTILNVDPGG